MIDLFIPEDAHGGVPSFDASLDAVFDTRDAPEQPFSYRTAVWIARCCFCCILGISGHAASAKHGSFRALSICRSIIQDHGGELWVTDNSDEPGAAFR